MPPVLPRRAAVAALGIGAAALGWSSVGVSGASTRAAATVSKPAKTVTARRIVRRPGTLAPGTKVRPSDVVGQRVFTGARRGFALASTGDADYGVATTDGGKTWKTDGPALHLHAAQAPLAVVFIGAANPRTVFAWGGGQVIDTTSDGGRNWYGALFPNGGPVAVARDFRGHLLAFIGSFNGARTWKYVSRDGGRTWHYQSTVGG